jgi:chaperonin cofactor prefoldin
MTKIEEERQMRYQRDVRITIERMEAEIATLKSDNRSLVEQMNQMAMRIEHKSGTAQRGYK